MMMTNDNKDETLIHWTVYVVNIIILKVIFGPGKVASASWFWSRPRQLASKVCPRHRRFVLGLENLSSFNITADSMGSKRRIFSASECVLAFKVIQGR